MERWLRGALLHLHFARAALGDAGLEIGIAEAGDELPAGSQAAAVVAVQQPERAGHAGAAALDMVQARPGIRPKRFSPGEPTCRALEVAGVW